MTKQVLLSIKGLQFMDEEMAEPVEILTVADYYNRNGTHYLKYEEPIEGTQDVIRNTIKIKKGYVELQKKGPYEVKMIFEQWKTQSSRYITPYGSMSVGIRSGEVSIAEDEYHIHVELNYILELEEEYLADSRVVLHVTSKDAPDLSLLS